MMGKNRRSRRLQIPAGQAGWALPAGGADLIRGDQNKEGYQEPAGQNHVVVGQYFVNHVNGFLFHPRPPVDFVD
jgi:hypothetical protein